MDENIEMTPPEETPSVESTPEVASVEPTEATPEATTNEA